MPTTINELPEPSGGPKPTPETAVNSAITPGGPAHVEFTGTLFGSPEPKWDTSPGGFRTLAPESESGIDWDWVRVPVKAGDHVIAKLNIEDTSWSWSVNGPQLGPDQNPAGDIEDRIAPVDGDYYFGADGRFARVDTPYNIDIWIDPTADMLIA